MTKQYFSISQVWYPTYGKDDHRHLVKYVEYNQILTRCGWWYSENQSGVWTTKQAPTCPECLEIYYQYLLMLRLPFPNGYDRYGYWVYRIELDVPLPKWGLLIEDEKLIELYKRIQDEYVSKGVEENT